MILEAIPARRHHCGKLARNLRGEHRDLLMRMKVSAHADLVSAFGASALRRAWLFDGELAALAGVSGTAASSEGMLWLAITDAASRYPHHVARGALRFMEEIMGTRRRVVTTILARDTAAVRLAYFLGFNVERREDRAGETLMLMAAERNT